ncbi:MAG: DUF4402 domain-containing protein [Sphingopyxis sp.]
MQKISPVLLRIAIGLALTGGLMQPVGAQCLLCEAGARNQDDVSRDSNQPQERPLRVEITADLDFSRLVAGPGGGHVTIDPATGRPVSAGEIHLVSGSGFSGRIHIEGMPGRMVRIDVPQSVSMTSASGGRATVSDISTGLSPLLRIGPDGRLDVALGGRLELSGSVDGEFRGRIPITINYE